MFITATLNQPWPTVSHVALAFRDGLVKDDCTPADIIMAASARNVPIVNNRVPYGRIADLAFECKAMTL